MISRSPEVPNIPLPHFPDPDEYALTIGEASELMRLERCKFASLRKVQRLCRDGQIDCQKITTSRNGQPIVEWLVSETSLRKRITVFEPKFEDGDALATPKEPGDASLIDVSYDRPTTTYNDVATPTQSGDADLAEDEEAYSESKGETVAAPDEPGDASFNEPSKAMLMIENARLTAELTGKSDFIDQVLDEKSFLREELRDARERGRDATKIAERMLETLETMAMGGKLERLPERQVETTISATRRADAGDNEPGEINPFGI